MDPEFPRAYLILNAYVEKKKFTDAVTEIEHVRRIAPPAWYWANAAYVYGRSGQSERAQQALSELLRLNNNGKIDPMTVADAYAGMKDLEQTIAWLEKAFQERSNGLVYLAVDPVFDHVRDDPRYRRIAARVGLPDAP